MVSEDSTPRVPPQDASSDGYTNGAVWTLTNPIKVEGPLPEFWALWKPTRQRRKEPSTSPEAYLNRREAATYLGVSVRFLEGNTSIPKINVAGPGSKRATWRYRRVDLDGWAAQRKAAHTVGSAD